MHYLIKGLLVWLLFIPLAVANGILRDLLLAPVLGDTTGRSASSLSLALLIYGLTLLLVKRIGVSTRRECLIVGFSWLVLTVLFESFFFVLAMGHPMNVLLRDHEIFRGPLWSLVLAMTLFAPLLAARARTIALP